MTPFFRSPSSIRFPFSRSAAVLGAAVAVLAVAGCAGTPAAAPAPESAAPTASAYPITVENCVTESPSR